MKSLRVRILVAFSVLVIVTMGATMFFVQQATENEILHLGKESSKNMLDIVYASVENEYMSVLLEKNAMLAMRRSKLADVVQCAVTLTQRYLEDAEEGIFPSEAVAKEEAAEDICSLTYDNGKGYFWICDTGKPYPKMIRHSNMNELDGVLLDDVRFNTAEGGRNFFQQAVEICEKQGKGFFEYRWPPLTGGSQGGERKLGYVVYFKKWNWVIASALSIDDVERAERERMNTAIEKLRSTFAGIKIAKSGYMYLFDKHSNVLIHPVLEGSDTRQLLNPETGTRMALDLIEASKNPDVPLSYLWDKPQHPGEFLFRKLSYVRHFEPFGWYIASSVYVDELNIPIRNVSIRILWLSGCFLLIALGMALVLSYNLLRPLKRLSDAALQIGKGGLIAGDIPVSGTSETRQLGMVLNAVLHSIRDAMQDKEQLLQALESSNRELRTINAMIEEARQVSDEANRLKSTFLSNMSHEIRTPLNCIIGFVEDMMHEDAAPMFKDRLRAVLAEAEILLALINDLLDHAKLEAGKVELEHMPFDLYDLLSAIERSVSPIVEKKGLVFRLSIAKDVEQFVVHDRLRLRQVIMNLVSNAIKFTERGSVVVSCSLVEKTPERQTLKFSVIDTGIGIPKAKHKFVFDTFTQADSSTTRRFGGTGLGTSIVRQLVALMKGDVNFDSEEGKGSTFRAVISFDLCTAEQKRVVALAQQSQGDDTEQRHSGVVLVVEDYRANQEVLRTHLESLSLTVVIAENGRQALALCHERVFDLVLLDVQMPDISGMDVARMIRQSYPHYATVPLIAVTADAEKKTREACLASGINEVLTKPVRRNHFLPIIKKYLRMGGNDVLPASAAGAETAPLDLENGIREFDGKQQYVMVVLSLLTSIKEQVPLIEQALGRREFDNVAAEVHKIKGGAANIMALPLANVASRIGVLIKAGVFERVPDEFALFKKECERLERFVEAM